MLFRYVTRYNVKDSSRHIILGTQQFKPTEFGHQINLRQLATHISIQQSILMLSFYQLFLFVSFSMDNAWGIVRCVLDIVMQQKVYQYPYELLVLLIRAP